MRALIIMPRIPPRPGSADFGIEKRARLFVEGIAQVCDEMEFLYLVPDSFLAAGGEVECTAEFVWGVQGTSTFVPLARRRETFVNHYLGGMLSARYGKSFFPAAGRTSVAAIRAALAQAPDFVFVDQLYAMIPVLEARPKVPLLFDLNDLMHLVHWRAATTGSFWVGKIAYTFQVPAILFAQLRGIRLAARTTVCAEGDRRVLARLGAGKRVAVVPNAVALPDNVTPIPSEPTLLFLGNYAYEPNLHAAERLVRKIWPEVRQRHPNARLLLAGGEMERLPSAKAPQDGVEYLGFVQDLDALYARSRVVCCPLDIGGGTRLKLIEAAAYGRPMVSTHVGAEGLDFRDGIEILLRDEDAQFAAACSALFSDDTLCMRLGAAARARMREHYESLAVREQITAMVRSIVAG